MKLLVGRGCVEHPRVTDACLKSGMPSICFVGGEDLRLRIPLLLALQRKGFDIVAVGSESESVFKRHSIRYRRYDLYRDIAPTRDTSSYFALKRIFRDLSPDVVHAFDTKPALIAPFAARAAGIRYVVRTITGMGRLFSSTDATVLPIRLAYIVWQCAASKLSNVTVLQNADDQAYFKRWRIVSPENAVLVQGSGIDVDKVAAPSTADPGLLGLRQSLGVSNALLIIMVARLVRQKGVAEYLQAAAAVKKRVSNVEFLLVGPRTTEGREAIPNDLLLKYQDSVRYLGPRTDVLDLLRISDIFVLPTYYREGVPRVLLEAGAIGLPLITTDMPGCRDVVKHEWNGLLVPPRNVPELTSALLRLIDNAELRKSLGKRNPRFIAENFDLRIVAERYAQIYRRLLSAPGYLARTEGIKGG